MVMHPAVPDILVFSLVVCLIFLNKTFNFNRNLTILLVILQAFAVLSMIATNSDIVDYWGVIFRIFIIYFLICGFNSDASEITFYIIRSIWIISYFALANLLLIYFVPSIFQLVESQEGYKVYTLFYIFNYLPQIENEVSFFIRNQSIFWEPGILQIPMSILLFYQFIEKKSSLFSGLVPAIIIVSTASTTGFILLGLLLLLRFIKIELRSNSLSIKVFFSIFLLCITPLITSEIDGKFNSEEKKTSSLLRTYDAVIGLQIAFENPFFGVGLGKGKYLLASQGRSILIDGIYFDEERGNTNTIVSMFAKLGAPFALFIIYLIYNQKLFKNRLIFFCLIIISLLSSPLLFFYIMILLIMTSSLKPYNLTLKKSV